MEIDKPYTPIACAFHDMLLERATFREKCQIVYRLSDKEQTESAVIKDVFTTEEGEFMLLDTGTQIRLDQLVRVDDTHLNPNC